MRKLVIAYRHSASVLDQTTARKARCNPKVLKNALIAKNAEDLIGEGKIEEAMASIAHMTGEEIAEAAQFIMDKTILLQQMRKIVDRYDDRTDAGSHELMVHAAAAHDMEIKILATTAVSADKTKKTETPEKAA
jgi:hypothetical protein